MFKVKNVYTSSQMATKTEPTTLVIFDVEPEDWNMKGSLFCSVWSLCRNSAASCWLQTPWWWPGLGTERSPLSLSLSLYLGLTWADGLTPAPCASNVRFPNAAWGEGCRYWPANERRVLSLWTNEERAGGFWWKHFTNCSFRKILNELFQSLRNSGLQCPHDFITLYVYITVEPKLKSPAWDC